MAATKRKDKNTVVRHFFIALHCTIILFSFRLSTEHMYPKRPELACPVYRLLIHADDCGCSLPAIFSLLPLQNQYMDGIVYNRYLQFSALLISHVDTGQVEDHRDPLREFSRRAREAADFLGVTPKTPHAAKKQRMNDPILSGKCDDSCIKAVQERIEYKLRDYATYNFTPSQSSSINIFFDLAQEFDDISQLYVLPVLVLRILFQYQAEFYVKKEQAELSLATPPVTGGISSPPPLRPEAWSEANRYYFPVHGRNALVLTKTQRIVTDENILGILVLYMKTPLESHDQLFLKKFTNRLGFCLHNKILAERNSRHILFLRKLAHDIGHNIITPNLRLKFLLHQLEGQVNALKDISENPADEASRQDTRILQRRIADQIKDISGHFHNSALFMESLLRQSHFDLGHYVLRRSHFDIIAMIVAPQFERYLPHFEERGLAMKDGQPVCPSTPCVVQADLGLISQVMANFLSNAVKYCAPPPRDNGICEIGGAVEIVPRAFEDGGAGVKVSVFSSGPNIIPDEVALLFDDNYRASNVSGQYGTGHGLFFVREIIAEHAGKTGYEPLPDGNIFYFMLPLVEE